MTLLADFPCNYWPLAISGKNISLLYLPILPLSFWVLVYQFLGNLHNVMHHWNNSLAQWPVWSYVLFPDIANKFCIQLFNCINDRSQNPQCASSYLKISALSFISLPVLSNFTVVCRMYSQSKHRSQLVTFRRCSYQFWSQTSFSFCAPVLLIRFSPEDSGINTSHYNC